MLAGASAMAVGTFMPIVHLPIIGTINYVAGGRGNGIIILGVATLIAALVFFGQRRVAAVAAFVAIVVMFSTIIQLLDILNKSRANAPNGLAAILIQAVGLEWGWLALIGGAFVVVGAGLMAPKESLGRATTKQNDGDASRVDEIVSNYIQMKGQPASAVHASSEPTHSFGRRATSLPSVGEVKSPHSVTGYLGVVVLVVLVGFVATLGTKEYLRREQVTETTPAQTVALADALPQQSQSTQPSIMRGADLYVDHDRLLGQRVRVRGYIYGASNDGALFESEGASFVIRQVSSDVMRRLLKGCSSGRRCTGTFEVTPAPRGGGDIFPRLANPTIIENK